MSYYDVKWADFSLPPRRFHGEYATLEEAMDSAMQCQVVKGPMGPSCPIVRHDGVVIYGGIFAAPDFDAVPERKAALRLALVADGRPPDDAPWLRA